MRWLDVVRMRARSLARRGRVEDELDRELRFHLEQEAEDYRSRGLSSEDARFAAMRRLDLQSLKDAAQTVPRLKPHREHP